MVYTCLSYDVLAFNYGIMRVSFVLVLLTARRGRKTRVCHKKVGMIAVLVITSQLLRFHAKYRIFTELRDLMLHQTESSIDKPQLTHKITKKMISLTKLYTIAIKFF